MEKFEIKSRQTNLDLFVYNDQLNRAIKLFSGKKILYAIQRNIDFIAPIIRAMQQSVLIPKQKEYEAYEKELNEAYRLLATLEDGTVKKINDGFGERFDMNVNSPEALAAKSVLELKYKSAIEKRQSDIKEYNEFLNMPCEEDLRVYCISMSDLPDDISGELFSLIARIIKPLPLQLEETYNCLMDQINNA